MKLSKKLVSLVLMLIFVLSLVACGNSKSVVGSWSCTKDDNVYSYVFEKDGTGTVGIGGITLDTEYKVEDNKISIIMSYLGQSQTSELTYSIKNDVLTHTDGTDTLELEKQK